MRFTSELRNARPGDGDALAKFNETVEPVILEYEKVVSALNKQLDELRSELVSFWRLTVREEAENKLIAEYRLLLTICTRSRGSSCLRLESVKSRARVM
jgi:hypothetical protein